MDRLALLGGKKTREKPFLTNAIIGKEEKRRVLEVLDSGMLSGFIAKAGDNFLGGKQVKEFEALVKKYFNVKHAVSVNSATAGLHIAVAACGIGPGDEVIVSPYTMSASATCIIMQNAIPIFADIDENTFCIDPLDIERKITSRTKAIVVVHLFGHPADMDRIMKVANKHDLYVIEDCAQAPGAKYKESFVGTIGDAGVFSLNQHKTITCGEGGFVVTNNDNLALRMQLVRNHGEVVVGGMDVDKIDNIVGFNYRMTELEAAVSIGQFRKLDILTKRRVELAGYLTKKLSKFKGLILPREKNGSKHVYFVYPIRFNEAIVGISRDVFIKVLTAEGIPFGAGYVRPIYMDPLYQKKTAYGNKGCPFTCSFYSGYVKYKKKDCPVAKRMHEKELIMTSICRYPHTKADMDYVIRAIDKVVNNITELKFQKSNLQNIIQ